ncbi:hypothetical protein ACFOSD_04695 [Salinispirillum marinum]|uniref:Big-1 domain-containing protein n=2 Tax=Saccharospirillaceae TaxID=255527 RepID=A0ABV8BEA2_9GAMM
MVSLLLRWLALLSVSLILVGCNEVPVDASNSDSDSSSNTDTDSDDDSTDDDDSDDDTTATLPAGAGFIEILPPSPTSIALQGYATSGLADFSKVAVRVLDFSGEPVANHTVNFELTNAVGGAELSWASQATNASGEAHTWLSAGSVPGVTQVEFRMNIIGATGTLLETNRHVATSQPINMSTAVPVTDGISLSTNVFNPEGYNYDGVPVTITAHLGDMHRNPVADGTLVNFITNTGMIVGSCPTTNGTCNAVWRSAAPRFTDGRIHILARTEGNDAFVDTNGNSRFDVGETYTPQGEPFVDANGSDSHTAGEFFWDRDNNNSYTAANPAAVYKGYGCSDAAVTAGHCAERADVFDSITLVNSGSIITLNPVPTAISGSQTVTYTMVDQNGNVPPVGSTLAISCEGDVETTLFNQTVPGNPGNLFSGWQVGVTYAVDGTATCAITVKSPNGAGAGNRYFVSVTP